MWLNETGLYDWGQGHNSGKEAETKIKCWGINRLTLIAMHICFEQILKTGNISIRSETKITRTQKNSGIHTTGSQILADILMSITTWNWHIVVTAKNKVHKTDSCRKCQPVSGLKIEETLQIWIAINADDHLHYKKMLEIVVWFHSYN